MRASSAQPHLGPSDKSYCRHSKLVSEGLEAAAFIHQLWIPTVCSGHTSPCMSTSTSSLLPYLQVGQECLSLLLRERPEVELGKPQHASEEPPQDSEVGYRDAA